MVIYPSTNILIFDKTNLEKVKSYLEFKGNTYSQNTRNSERKEFHYFFGNSSVFIKEFKKKADIKIFSEQESFLNDLKRNIQDVLYYEF